MKVLSIKQPWAWLICVGCKTIENRTWARKYRGPVLIHASKTPASWDDCDDWMMDTINEFLKEHNMKLPKISELPKSAIIGCATLYGIDSKETLNDPFAFDYQYHWQFKHAKLFDKPIKNVKGKVFLWDYSLNKKSE